MICPDTDYDCDNPGCRHGGCQGRRPALPLLRTLPTVGPATSRQSVEPALLRMPALHTDANA
ncbi:MAG: hypothetical protein ACM3JG_02345 [Thiohalocapsa sp.]